MDMAEMHVYFRQYAQQMGMQNVRGILPEQIDIVINTSIIDTVNQLIRENIGITKDSPFTDNSKIGQINALRTLYKVHEIDFNIGTNFIYNVSDRLIGLIKHNSDTNGDGGIDSVFGNYMFLVGLNINYTSKTPDNDGIKTSWYTIRLVDDAYLSDTLNDVILKNRWKSPIAIVYDKNTIELYIDKFTKTSTPNNVEVKVKGLENTIIPKSLRISTIQYPAKVKYSSDNSNSIDCDLPESMHVDIVKHAVDLYRIATNGSLYTNQASEQAQQQENIRNNNRN